MKCPKCRHHVTPLGTWILEYVDDPGKCPHCGVRLLPSHRMLWWTPLLLPFALVAIIWAVFIEFRAEQIAPAGRPRGFVWWVWPARLGVVLAVALVNWYAYWLVWVSGTYSLDESDPGGATAAGASLDPYDLEQLVRGALLAEKDGDLKKAIAKYQSIAEYAGGSHPNAELARERVRELQARLGEPDAAPGEDGPRDDRPDPRSRPWTPRRD